MAASGFSVEAVDRDISAMDWASNETGVHVLRCDLENEPWPYAADEFAAIVVVRYLHRALFPELLLSLAPGGVLIYETFAVGQERFGRPSNPDFLLRPGELLEWAHGELHVVAFEQGMEKSPAPALLQRICAVRSPAPSAVFPLIGE
jgi:SAM-dependent methyltransferase